MASGNLVPNLAKVGVEGSNPFARSNFSSSPEAFAGPADCRVWAERRPRSVIAPVAAADRQQCRSQSQLLSTAARKPAPRISGCLYGRAILHSQSGRLSIGVARDRLSPASPTRASSRTTLGVAASSALLAMHFGRKTGHTTTLACNRHCRGI